jgi:large subunit ribosomal protein L19
MHNCAAASWRRRLREAAMSERLRNIEAAQLKKSTGGFAPGDTVRVHVKVSEGGRERLQVFEGTVIGRRGAGIGESFTVRRVSHGVGVERIFPLHSPRVERVDVVRKGRVRRAKLHYLRGRIGKETRVREQR